jgi:hypothetical protein
VLFGGARGGGKSDALLGDWVAHAGRAKGKAGGVIFRRTMPELEELIARSHELYHELGAGWSAGRKTWVFPCGATLKMRWLDRDQDADHYQGHQYCVGIDTPVRMADGAWKPISDINIGDMVATLAGPKRVSATVRPYIADSVRADVSFEGEAIGSQVHPVWHPVLSTDGLISKQSILRSNSAEQSQESSVSPSSTGAAHLPDGHQGNSAWFAYSEDDRNGCKASLDGSGGVQPPVSLSAPVVLHAPTLRSALQHLHNDERAAIESRVPCVSSESWSHSPELSGAAIDKVRLAGQDLSERDRLSPCFANAPSCVQNDSCEEEGWTAGCPIGAHYHDERVPVWSESVQPQLLSQADVGARFHELSGDGSGTTPKHNLGHQQKWVHPYSGEEIHLSEDVEVGRVDLHPCGKALVCDITVEESNHYITKIGLVNKNTYIGFDEAGTWPEPAPIDKLRATLRSPHGVPCLVRLTANPGGSGQQWLTQRYITPAPAGVPFFDAERKTWRVFIPARLGDNRKLIEADPGYEDRIRSSGPAWLVRAWLDGDWSASAGQAFFTENNLLVPNAEGGHDPIADPDRCDYVAAVIDTAVKTGSANDGTGIVYIAIDKVQRRLGHPPLRILDWDIQQIEGALLETWLPTVFQNLEHYAKLCGARYGSGGVWIEDKSSGMVLLQQAQRRGWPAQPIESALTSVGKDERAISVSGYVYRGEVKLTERAFNKIVTYKDVTRNHLLSQVTGFRVGDKDARTRQDDLLDAFCYSIALSLGDSGAF